jgi:CheY-like chemotaxis protein
MNKNGPVLVIEDDFDDQEILTDVFKKLNYSNEIIFFRTGQDALDFLMKAEISPFIILSDMNLPVLSGFDLRQKLKTDAQLALKCIPYLYLSSSPSPSMVVDAYSASAQGFFIKEDTIAKIEKTISLIMEYWKNCIPPILKKAG